MSQKIISIMAGYLMLMMGGAAPMATAQASDPSALNARQQAIVSMAALTATGDLENLKTALTEGLNTGLSVNEIKEVLIHMYAYTGFPRSLNGINTFMGVMEDRQKQGITDSVGQEPKAVRTDVSRYEVGKENLAVLTGVQPPAQQTGYAAFVPTIEVFLKEHLFADIFERGVLDYQTRELITITALASIGGVNAQLRSHLNVGIHNGLSEPQLRGLMDIVAVRAGKVQSDNANEVLNQVLRSR